MSARTKDINDFIEIKGNPISRVGVFPYLGRSISDDCIPDKIYQVYRPADELSHPDCIQSFKLLPFTDEHAMLGSADDGMTPAEHRAGDGTIGEDVYFEESTGMLRGNIKLWSERVKALLAAGKEEVSAGYRCVYEKATGVFNGQTFDYIQRAIRGNHVALVAQGRMGPDVRVLDHMTFTIDAKELPIMTKEEMKAALDEALAPVLASNTDLTARLAKLEKSAMDADEDDDKKKKAEDAEEDDKDKKKAEDADEDEEKKKKAEDEDEDDKEKKKSAEDSAEILKQLKATQDSLAEISKNGMKVFAKKVAARDALVAKLTPHVGTFDASEMDVDDVAVYGCDKLKINAPAEAARYALDAYLSVKKAPTAEDTMFVAAADKAANPFKDYVHTKH